MLDRLNCPICLTRMRSPGRPTDGDSEKFECPRCGSYVLSGTAQASLETILDTKRTARVVLIHAVRRMQRLEEPPPLITTDIAELVSPVIQTCTPPW